MSKENMKRFLEKVSTNPELADTIIALAKKNGFELTADDFKVEECAVPVNRSKGTKICTTFPSMNSSDDVIIYQQPVFSDEDNKRYFERLKKYGIDFD